MGKNQSQVVGMLVMSDVTTEDPVVIQFDPEAWPAVRQYDWTYDSLSGEVVGRRTDPETGKVERVHLEEAILTNLPEGWWIGFADEDIYNYRKDNLVLSWG